MRLKSFDNYLMTFMSAVALLCLYMLYGTNLVGFKRKPELKVAEILEQLKTVKRKKDFYQGWSDVRTGDPLTHNEEIYTHGQSSAKIRFTNGPEISLFENSLLRIKDLKSGSTLSLDKGHLIAKLDKNISQFDIELNGKKYTFKSDNATIQIEKGKTENKFLLLEGRANFKNQEILPNQVVIQDIKTDEFKVKAIPFAPKSPLHNSTHYFLRDIQMNFSWSYTGSQAPSKLVIARDSNFSDIVFEEKTDANSLQVPLNQEGTYYWKVASLDDLESPIKSFILTEERAPLIQADQTVFYQGPKSQNTAILTWSKDSGKNFILKIESPDKNQKELKLSKNTYEFLPESLGSYKVSVKINDEDRPLSLWSEPLTIAVNEAKPIEITSLSPEYVEKVHYSDQSFQHFLSWSGPTSGVQYKIKISHGSSLNEGQSELTSFPITLKEPGIYTWEIQGIAASGILSNKITGKISLKAPLALSQLPSEGAVVALEKPDQLVAFKWNKVNEATLYQFELSNDSHFKNIINRHEVDTNNISTSVAEIGKYYWRVKIKKGESIEYSRPVSVEIKPAPPLSRPEVSPDIKVKLKYLEEKSSSINFFDLFIGKAHAADQTVVAEWDLPANMKAKSYTVEIYRDQALSELITKIETDIPRVIWKNAMPGIFYWRVSYTDFWGRKTEFSKVSTLSTEEIEIPKPEPVEIGLSTPKHHAEILPDEKDHSLFSWEVIPDAKNYQILVASDLEFEKIIFKKSITQNQLKVTCKDLSKNINEYYWKIISGDNASKRRAFSAKCTPIVTLPVVASVPVAEVDPKKDEVKKEEPKEATKAIEVQKAKVVGHLPHVLNLSYLPHHITYQNKASQYSAKINGNAVNSWMVSYQRPLDLKFTQMINPTLEISRGKVFKNITFTDMELDLKFKRLEKNFSWGVMASYMKKSIYKEEGLAITDESVTAPLIGLFIEKKMNQFKLGADAKLGSILSFRVDLDYGFGSSLSVGAFLDNSTLSKDDGKHSFNRYGLKLNYAFNFLESAN